MNKKTCNICVIDEEDICQYNSLSQIKELDLSQKSILFYEGSQAITYLNEMLSSANVAKLPDMVVLDLDILEDDVTNFVSKYINLQHGQDKNILLCLVSDKTTTPHSLQELSENSDFRIKIIDQKEFSFLFSITS